MCSKKIKIVSKIGIITIEQQIKAIKKANREAELEQSPGWTATNKIHKSDKTYTRKNKHKSNE